jgi:hypothetical protein
MALTALSKRWFLYLVIGQMAVLWVETGLEIIAASRRSRSITLSSIGAAIYGPFLCVCSLAGVYFLSFPLPFKILTTDYSTIFAAYQTSDSWLSQIVDNLGHIVQQFGIAQTVLSFLCFVAALFFTQTRRAAVYLYVPALAAWADFSKVQNMAEQHILLVYIALAVTPLFLAQQLLSAKLPAGKAWGWSVLALMVLISCLSFESVFASAPPLGSSFVQAMLPTYRKPPAQRHDIAELEALMNFVGDKVATASGKPPVADVYLLSSSQLLNSSHLSTLGLQLNEVLPAGDHICLTNDVDLRDGFPNLLLSAKLVLVADPVQTHLAADQKVITVPVRMFLQDEAFAHAFTRDPHSFQLDDGVRVYAFERVRPSTPEEIDQLRREIGVPSKKNPAKIEQ